MRNKEPLSPEQKVGIGHRLKKTRKSLGLTQEKMAELFDVSRTYYGEVERGRGCLSLKQFLKLYELGADLNYLLGGAALPGFEGSGVINGSPEDKVRELEQRIQEAIDILQSKE